MNTAAPASARATCTARLAARAPAGRRPRGSDAAVPCRPRSPTTPFQGVESLRQDDPLRAVSVVDLHGVTDGVEDPAEVERIRAPFPEFGPHGGERADDHPELTVLDEHPKRHLSAIAWTFEQRVERKLEILEVLEAQVQPRGEPAQHEMGDAVEGVVRRQRQT